METTKKQAEAVNEQEQNQVKKTQKSMRTVKKPQEELDQQGIEARKVESKGLAAQRGAVGQEFEADRAKGKTGGKAKTASSKDMPASPETGKKVGKDSAKDQDAVGKYAQSNGKKKADEKAANKSQNKKANNPKKDQKTVEDKQSSKEAKADKKAEKDQKADKKARDEKEAKKAKDEKKQAGNGEKDEKIVQKEEKDAAKKEESKQKDKAQEAKAEEKVAQAEGKEKKQDKASGDGASSAKGDKKVAKKDKEAKAAVGAGTAKGGKAKGKGGGGGGGGGAGISVPSIGGGGPTVTPKGAGGGANAIEAFANSGASYQFENLGGLSAKASADLEKDKAEIDTSLPGEAGAVINDGAADAAMKNAMAATKSVNEGQKASNFDAEVKSDVDSVNQAVSSVAETAKSTLNNASSESIPNKPVVDADYSAIDAAQAEQDAKFAAAQSAGIEKASSMDTTVTPRGFDDLNVPKAELEAEATAMEVGEASLAPDVASLTEEGKGILDISEFAEQASSSMESVKAQVAEAEETRKSETESAIAEHEDAISEEIEKANEQEAKAIESNKNEVDSKLQAEADNYDSEVSGFNAEQQAEIAAARSEMDAEKANTQAKIDAEHKKANDEKTKAEKENDNKGGGVIGWIKDKAQKFVSWLKEKVSGIVNAFKNAVCSLLDAFVAIVSKINKNLGEKLKKVADKFKSYLDKLCQALIDIVNKFLDAVLEAVNAILDAVVAAIEALVEAFKEALKAIWEALKAAFDAALEAIKAALSALGELFLMLLKKAIELCGIDPGVFANAFGVAKEIIQHPGTFFSALGRGFVDGFKNFGANIVENVKAIFTNLFNMWLGTAGLSLPGDFSLPSLLKFGFDVIGIDINSILNAFGAKNLEDMESIDDLKDISIKKAIENNPAYQTFQKIRKGGIGAILDMAKEFVSDFLGEIRDYAIETIVTKASTAAISKLAMLSNPVSGIVAVVKAVWDLIQFVRENMSAISGLVSAVTSTLAQAAVGDSSGVAAGVEAALCRLIPLAIDLLLRLAGINVGGAIQKVVGKIRGKVQAIVDKIIGKIKSLVAKTPIGQLYEKGKEAVDTAKGKVEDAKDAIKGKIDGAVDTGIDKVNSVVDPKLQAGMDKFNNSEVGQGVAQVNSGAQKMADRINSFTESATEKTAGVRSTMGAITDTLNDFNSADKYGDAFGLTADSFVSSKKEAVAKEESETVSEASEQVVEQESNMPNANAEVQIGDSAKDDAWQRYQAKKAAEGKPIMDYEKWSANYDNLAKARETKRENEGANVAGSSVATELSSFVELTSLDNETAEQLAVLPMTSFASIPASSPELEQKSADPEPVVQISDEEVAKTEQKAEEAEKEKEPVVEEKEPVVEEKTTDVSYGTWAEVAPTLQNTSIFNKGALKHIFSGEVKNTLNRRTGRRSKVGAGFHYEGISNRKGSVVEGTRTEANEFGVYEAKVQVNGIDKGGNDGGSSFFPTSMSPQEVVDAINEAYNNRRPVTNKGRNTNIYYGYTSSGLCIQMMINNDKISTAFPKYDNANGHLY